MKNKGRCCSNYYRSEEEKEIDGGLFPDPVKRKEKEKLTVMIFFLSGHSARSYLGLVV
jgi:hypothetical protein